MIIEHGLNKCLANYTNENMAEIAQKNSLIPPPPLDYKNKLLVLDLDETLVHSSFMPVTNSDDILELFIEDPFNPGTIQKHIVYVYRRPHLQEFLRKMAETYELCVFTASIQVYCDAVIDRIDPDKLIKYRLYRTQCT